MTTMFRAMRPDRPLPEELVHLLENQSAYHADGTVHVLRRTRILPTMTYVGMAIAVLVVTLALVGLVFTFSTADGLYIFRTITGVLAWVVTLAFMVVTIRRIKGDKRYLLLSEDYLAFVGDPLGVQWAPLEEVSSISFSVGTGAGYGGGIGTGGTDTASSLDVIYRSGDVEQIFVGEVFVDHELAHWQRICDRVLEINREDDHAEETLSQ